MDEWQYELAKEREQQERKASIKAVLSRPNRSPGEEQIIEDGEVICLDCHDPIPTERIEIYPAAVRCVECQGAWEIKHNG